MGDTVARALALKNKINYDNIIDSKTQFITQYTNTVTVGAESATVSIGIAEYNLNSDMLFVFANSTFLALTGDYTITDSEAITKSSGTWDSGTVFDFVVLKRIFNDENLFLDETAEKTTDYTLVLDDSGKIVVMNKTGQGTVTIPKNDTVDFPVGVIINVYNISTDLLDIVGATDVVVRNAGVVEQYGEVSLRKRADNEWVVAGDVL